MKRVQQIRGVKGWKKPDNTRSVSRATKFGNPFKVSEVGRDRAISLFKECMDDHNKAKRYFKPSKSIAMTEYFRLLKDSLGELKEYDNLMCFCSLNEPCHADHLIKLIEK